MLFLIPQVLPPSPPGEGGPIICYYYYSSQSIVLGERDGDDYDDHKSFLKPTPTWNHGILRTGPNRASKPTVERYASEFAVTKRLPKQHKIPYHNKGDTYLLRILNGENGEI